MNSRQPLTPR